jgi:hypothetical protein
MSTVYRDGVFRSRYLDAIGTALKHAESQQGTAAVAEVYRQSLRDSSDIKSIRWMAQNHASLTGQTAEQVLELALTQERAAQKRAQRAAGRLRGQ